MKRTSMYSLRQFVVAAVFGVFAALVSSGAVSVDLADEPLFVTGGAEPNIMFVIDDSGSMHFEVTPDEAFRYYSISNSVGYVYPRASNVYGDGDYNSVVPTVDKDSAFNARARSPQINYTYYNPSVTYTPWVRHDGTLYPNADPEKAYHNPEKTSAGYRNLTVDNTSSNSGDPDNGTAIYGWMDCNAQASCWWEDENSKTYWPAYYFWFKGGDEWNLQNYDGPVEIRPGVTYTGHGRRNRTDCVAGSCTYDQEIQNFANWYTYYRSRTLAARAGVGRAFSQQGELIRVGYGSINTPSNSVDGVDTQTILEGVRPFKETARQTFFTRLYESAVPNSGTPLRRALDDAGQYFSRTDDKGPYSSTPGQDDNVDAAEEQLSCRANYTILMTDGYWSGDGANTSGATTNVDGTSSDAITGPDGQSFTYTAEHPFSDDNSNTLADVAMYYWKRDLRDNLDNEVPVSDLNPAFWQHMVTFGVGFGVFGSVDPDTAFAAIEDPESNSFSWPDPGSSKTSENIDDLLHASVNSRGGFFSAADPDTFAKKLNGVLRNILERTQGSASTVAANSTRLGTETNIFQASFDTTNWTGEIKAWELNEDGSVNSDPKWTTEGRISPDSYATRNVYTYNGSTGLSFSKTSWVSMTQAQRNALIGAEETVDNVDDGKLRIDWVRGRNDIPELREREDLLGDIVNSSPVLAGSRSYRFESLPDDLGGDSYEQYVANYKEGRSDVLYVGANDGMLHAFDAATGNELFSYVPSTVYDKLYDMSLPNYGRSPNGHEYSVDGPIFVGDAYFTHGGVTKWRNILVGTLGAGGKGIYVLDVTDPESFDASDVLFEITAGDFPKVGNVLGEPIVAPTVDGWKIIFGNGYNSNDGKAYLFAVDLSNPTGDNNKTVVIATDDQLDNGLSTPSLLMSGEGRVADVYAGDLQGRMWKFDFSASNSSNWASAFKSGNTPVPFFTARDDSGNVQAITSAPVLGVNREMNDAIMVYFGTGRYLTLSDNLAGDTVQSVYALADQGASIHETDRSTLLEKVIVGQSVISSGDNADRIRREVSNNDDTSWWENKDGWYLDLHYDDPNAESSPKTGERVISKPLLVYDRLIFPTLITSDDPCSAGSHGWLMELVAVGDRYTNHSILGEDGLSLDNAVMGLSEVLRGGEKLYIPTSNIKGEIDTEEGDLPAEAVGRMSWRQLR